MKPLSALSLLLSLPLTTAAALTKITTDFGPNPRNVSFNIFVPDKLAPNPPVLVNPHWCHGTAQNTYEWTQWATLASKHGFIVIYPDSPNAADQCWDISSKETLTHDGGGDALGIVSMVRWTLDKYDGDRKRVFVTGVSSGGMMTQALVGSYPDVFAAGAAFAGVPFGCFAPEDNEGAYDYWNDQCATGKVTHDGKVWGDIVRGAYPGYDGWRPKLQLFHGTVDEVVSYVNHGEAVKMWTNVLGLSETPVKVEQDTPLTGWTKSVYGLNGWLEAYSAAGVTHDIKVQEATVMAFFELDCTSECFSWGREDGCEPSSPVTSTKTTSTVSTTSIKTTSTTLTTTTSTSTTKAPVTTTSPVAGQTLWGQCAGSGYSGPTACVTGGCTTYNPWYGQCVPTPGP